LEFGDGGGNGSIEKGTHGSHFSATNEMHKREEGTYIDRNGDSRGRCKKEKEEEGKESSKLTRK